MVSESVMQASIPPSKAYRRGTYTVRSDFAVSNPSVDLVVLGARDVDDGVYDGVGHMHTLGAELSSQRLAQRADGKLARSKSREPRRAPDRRRRAGDDQGWRVWRVGYRLKQQREGFLGEVEESATGENASAFE